MQVDWLFNNKQHQKDDLKIYQDLSQIIIARNKKNRKIKNFTKGGGWSSFQDDQVEPYKTPTRIIHRNYHGGSDQMSQLNRQALPSFRSNSNNTIEKKDEEFDEIAKRMALQWNPSKFQNILKKNTSNSAPQKINKLLRINKKEEELKSFQIKSLKDGDQSPQKKLNLSNFYLIQDTYKQKVKNIRAMKRIAQKVSSTEQNSIGEKSQQLSKEILKDSKNEPSPNVETRKQINNQIQQCFDPYDPQVEQQIIIEVLRFFSGVAILPKDIDTFIEENYDYIAHQIGVCACARCICGQCKCSLPQVKLTTKCQFNSIYNAQFSNNNQSSPSSYRTPQLNQQFYDTLSLSQNVLGQQNFNQTTNQAFQEQTRQASTSTKIKRDTHNDQIKSNFPFLGITQNQAQFRDWGNYDNEIFSQPIQTHVIDSIPFMSRTTYGATFIRGLNTAKTTRQISPVDEIKESQKHQTFLKLYPQTNRSSYNEQYTGDQTISLKSCMKYQSQLDKKYEVSPSYKNQYISVNKQDFSFKNNVLCPGKTRNPQQERIIELIKQAASKLKNK